jgi:apolipoprotein D and lipocalin family protein
MTRGARRMLAALGVLVLAGCNDAGLPPVPTVAHVDLPRFMGNWYVIANIPTSMEKDAYGPQEHYRLAEDGTIETTFTFNAGGFDGKLSRHTARGFVVDHASNAAWKMQFIWPLRFEYLIAELAPDYSTTIIARSKRDYVWIMARTPHVDDATYQRLVDGAVALGYPRERIQKVPQP